MSNDTLSSPRDGNPDCYMEKIVNSVITALWCLAIIQTVNRMSWSHHLEGRQLLQHCAPIQMKTEDKDHSVLIFPVRIGLEVKVNWVCRQTPMNQKGQERKVWVEGTRAETNNIWKAEASNRAVCVWTANPKAADMVELKETFQVFWKELSSSFNIILI